MNYTNMQDINPEVRAYIYQQLAKITDYVLSRSKMVILLNYLPHKFKLCPMLRIVFS